MVLAGTDLQAVRLCRRRRRRHLPRVRLHPRAHGGVRSVTRRLLVEADGGSRGNPGVAAGGAVVIDDASGDGPQRARRLRRDRQQQRRRVQRADRRPGERPRARPGGIRARADGLEARRGADVRAVEDQAPRHAGARTQGSGAHRGPGRLVRMGAAALQQASGCRGQRVHGSPARASAGTSTVDRSDRARPGSSSAGRGDVAVAVLSMPTASSGSARTIAASAFADWVAGIEAAAPGALGLERHAALVRRAPRAPACASHAATTCGCATRSCATRRWSLRRTPLRAATGVGRRSVRRARPTPRRRCSSSTRRRSRPGRAARRASTTPCAEFARQRAAIERLHRSGPTAAAHRRRICGCARRGGAARRGPAVGRPRRTTRSSRTCSASGRRRAASPPSSRTPARARPRSAGRPGGEPRLPAEAAAQSSTAPAILVESTSRWELARVPASGHRAPPGVQEAFAAAVGQRLVVARGVGARRPLPAGLCPGRGRDRPLGVIRWRSAAAAASAAECGSGRPRLAARDRGRRTARAAGAGRDGRRPRAGRCRARQGPLRRHRRDAAPSRRGRRPRSPCSARCTARPPATAVGSVPRLRRTFPRAMALVDDAARTGENGGVGRPLAGAQLASAVGRAGTTRSRARARSRHPASTRRARAAWARDRGRFTRNFVVQGTAAEWALAWMADLRGRLAALPAVAAVGCRSPLRSGVLHGGRTWRSSSTTRSSSTHRPSTPRRPRRRSAMPPRRRHGSCSAISRSTSRSICASPRRRRRTDEPVGARRVPADAQIPGLDSRREWVGWTVASLAVRRAAPRNVRAPQGRAVGNTHPE